MTPWQRWIRHPQSLWLRKACFQVHLWSGVGVGLYILMISVTGSVLVYRNELFNAATPFPIIATSSDAMLTEDQLKDAATRLYPGYSVASMTRARNPNQAVDISLERGGDLKRRLFDPYTGRDLGNSVPLGIWLVSRLLELHDDLLAGKTGRSINGVGALLVVVLTLTGMVIWWPGIKTWRRSLTVHTKRGWQRFTWELHGMMGFWSLGFILLFGITGAYLGNPGPFHELADRLEPLTEANAGQRPVDQILYWLAYLHFGRLGGRGIPGCGRGLCDSATKAIWALFGLVPACLFVTGVVMWWNRVLRKRPKSVSPSSVHTAQ
jgi:uncharacterized iron-regulated membrane protein